MNSVATTKFRNSWFLKNQKQSYFVKSERKFFPKKKHLRLKCGINSNKIIVAMNFGYKFTPITRESDHENLKKKLTYKSGGIWRISGDLRKKKRIHLQIPADCRINDIVDSLYAFYYLLPTNLWNRFVSLVEMKKPVLYHRHCNNSSLVVFFGEPAL